MLVKMNEEQQRGLKELGFEKKAKVNGKG